MRELTQIPARERSAFPRIPRPYSKGHRNADHLDDGGRPQDALGIERGLGKRLRTSGNTPGRDQTNVGDARARLGDVPLARGEGEVRILSSRTHARRDYRITTGFVTGRFLEYRENMGNNALQ